MLLLHPLPLLHALPLQGLHALALLQVGRQRQPALLLLLLLLLRLPSHGVARHHRHQRHAALHVCGAQRRQPHHLCVSAAMR
jgi:hypothetical protein